MANSGVPAEEVRCIQYKKVSQFANEVHVVLVFLMRPLNLVMRSLLSDSKISTNLM